MCKSTCTLIIQSLSDFSCYQIIPGDMQTNTTIFQTRLKPLSDFMKTNKLFIRVPSTFLVGVAVVAGWKKEVQASLSPSHTFQILLGDLQTFPMSLGSDQGS